MKALIDADWFAYAFGNATDDEYKPLAWPFVKSRIDGTIRKIIESTGSVEYQLYLTSADRSNFRFDVATIRPYKGNRPTDKPHYYDKIRDYLSKGKGAIVITGMEADDAVSIAQYADLDWFGPYPLPKEKANTVLCSIDKDLDMVTGWHYNWMKEDLGVYWQDPTDGLRCFYKQLLTGDSVDNIPGLFGVGKASTLLKKLDDMTTEQEMYDHVQKEYEKRFGSYYYQFMMENAKLLWMLKETPETFYIFDWEKEEDRKSNAGSQIAGRLKDLESQRQQKLKEKEDEI